MCLSERSVSNLPVAETNLITIMEMLTSPDSTNTLLPSMQDIGTGRWNKSHLLLAVSDVV